MISKVEQQIKTKNRINTLKVVSVFLIIGFVFVGLSFADDAGTQKVDDLAKVAHFIVSFLSRGRALFATLAGKAMSNDWIYGSFMHLDIFLWKTRNIMKNFANYTLGFLFLYMIIKSVIKQDGASDLIKKQLVGFVLAGVLIQASRFLIGAVVDIATIAVTAIGAIPGQIIQSDMGLQNKLGYMNAGGGANLTATGEIMTGTVITFDPNTILTNGGQYITKEQKALDRPITQDNYLDMILPSYNTISGPLIFFGTSIFQFQDYSFSNPETTTSRKWLMEFALNLIVILIYSIAMLALLIINVFRIFFLRIVIIFSPFIILLGILGNKSIGVIDASKIKGLEKISIGSVLKLIFKPVLFMAYISIMMIFVIGVRAILIPMNGGEVKLNEEIRINSQEISNPAGGNSYNSSIKSDGIFNFSVNGAKKSIADLIVCFFTLFLLWMLIKIAIGKSEGGLMSPIENALQGYMEKAKNIAGEVPIVPIKGGESVGVSSVFGDNKLLDRASSRVTDTMSAKNQENADRLLGERSYRETDTKALRETFNNDKYETFWNKSKDISNEITGGLNITNSSRTGVIEERREKYKDKDISGKFKIGEVELAKGNDAKDFITINRDKIQEILKKE